MQQAGDDTPQPDTLPCEGRTELFAVHGVVTRSGVAELSSAQCTKGYAEPGGVQARERALQPPSKPQDFMTSKRPTNNQRAQQSTHAQTASLGQQVLLGDFDVLHENHASDGGAEGELAFNLWG